MVNVTWVDLCQHNYWIPHINNKLQDVFRLTLHLPVLGLRLGLASYQASTEASWLTRLRLAYIDLA